MHPHDIVNISNPTAKDITVHYDKKPFTLEAGDTATYPRYIAEHICTHLTNREIRKKDEKKVRDVKKRKEWYDKIIVGVKHHHAMTEIETDDGRDELIDHLKRTNDEMEARMKKLEAMYNKEVPKTKAGAKKSDKQKAIDELKEKTK